MSVSNHCFDFRLLTQRKGSLGTFTVDLRFGKKMMDIAHRLLRASAVARLEPTRQSTLNVRSGLPQTCCSFLQGGLCTKLIAVLVVIDTATRSKSPLRCDFQRLQTSVGNTRHQMHHRRPRQSTTDLLQIDGAAAHQDDARAFIGKATAEGRRICGTASTTLTTKTSCPSMTAKTATRSARLSVRVAG